jgi:3-deoxy-D-manno-octulosonic-acid transferase
MTNAAWAVRWAGVALSSFVIRVSSFGTSPRLSSGSHPSASQLAREQVNHAPVIRFLYNVGFHIFFACSAPFYFLKMWRRGNWQAGFGQRFARYDSKFKQAITNRDIIWFHAVSVGEVNICTQLIKALEPRAPNLKIVVSSTTSTGMAELQKKLPSHISKIYYPIDVRAYVRRAFRLISPEAIVLVEAEIWPNFLWRARDLGTPVFLVNARLSEKSHRGYKKWSFLFAPLFRSFAGVGCQNEADAKRLEEIGCRKERIHVVGNLKFDAATVTEKRLLDVPRLLAQLGVPPDTQLIVAGSTHAGEEKILGEVFLRLRARFPNLFLIVVPRHHERGREAGRDLESAGVKFIYRNEITPSTQRQAGELNALLVNTTGELRYFYDHATAVFVGKSLTADGGQNPIEPGARAKPMVFGPNMQNFEAIAKLLVERNGALQVPDVAELERAFAKILADPDGAAKIGANAQAVVKENLGSIERTVEMILAHLPQHRR